MTENKKKYAYWMRPTMVAEIEKMIPDANAKSKSDFVCKSVDFYIGYLKCKTTNIRWCSQYISATRRRIIEF